MSNNLGLLKPDQVLGGTGEFEFIISGIVNRIQTVTLVQVIAVNATGIGPVGTVDVQPMVAQLDGSGKAYAHGVIHNIPYFRLQGGSNAVIIDPEVGDIGMCGFCSRDISSVKVNKAPRPHKADENLIMQMACILAVFLTVCRANISFSKIRALSWFLPVKFC